MTDLEEKLKKKLSDEGVRLEDDDGKLLKECVLICNLYNLSVEDLYHKWTAAGFNSVNRNSAISGHTYTPKALEKVKRDLRRSLAASTSSGRAQAVSASGAVRAKRVLPGFMQQNATDRLNKPTEIEPAGGAPTVQVKVEQDGSIHASGPSFVTFRGPRMDAESRKKRKYRYMYEKITERSEALDDRIDEFAEIIKEHYKISELGDPAASADEDIVVVGRITHDYDLATSTSKLTEATLTLESSRMLSAGALIPLGFANNVHVRGGARGASGMGFFPGSMVALKGKSGVRFMASEILAIPPLKPSPAALGTSEGKLDSEPDDSPFSACVASGPFTHDGDLEYKPWQILLQALKARKPNAVILIGPFVDALHPKIQAGELDSDPSQIFTREFTQPLRAYLDVNPGGIVIIVPSVRDLLSEHAVFPQSEFTFARFDSRIHFVPNPAIYSLNGITFAATSVDVLFHLRKQEYFKRCGEINSLPPSQEDPGTDPMVNTCRHLLQQRSIYPIFPAPLDLAHEVNLDVSHWGDLKLDQVHDGYAPDILILPSRLKHFNKMVHSTTAINPGSVNKNTYATIEIGEGAPGKPLKERMKVEIVSLTQ